MKTLKNHNINFNLNEIISKVSYRFWLGINVFFLAFLANFHCYGYGDQFRSRAAKIFPKTFESCISSTKAMIPLASDLVNNLFENQIISSNFFPKRFIKAYDSISSYSYYDCSNIYSLRKVIKHTKIIRNHHTKKIGVILSNAKEDEKYTLSIIQGLSAGCVSFQCSKNIKIKKIDPNNQYSIKLALAQLIINDGVSVIIGGFNLLPAQILNHLSHGFHLPVFLLGDHKTLKLAKNSFVMVPSDGLIAKRIVQSVSAKPLKRLAILRAQDHSHKLNNYVKNFSKNYGVDIVADYSYIGDNYDSMFNAAQKLFKLVGFDRQIEYQDLVESHRKIAQQNNVEFDIEKVHLPPLIEFDNLLLADNAKVLIHFLKIFQYLSVQGNLNLIGSYLWRAPELINPWQPLLHGAMFFDYIGNYHNIPKQLIELSSSDKDSFTGINVSTNSISIDDFQRQTLISHNGMFIDSNLAAQIDYKLIAYRSILIAQKLFHFYPQKRSKFGMEFRNLRIHNSLRQPIKVFYDNHYINWKTYRFVLSRGVITQLDGN